MKFKEIETKYDAKDISLPAFTDLVNDMKPKSWMMVSSYDDYFVNKDNDFIRYRHTDERGELTIKKKTTDKNNNERLEVNVPTKGGQFIAVDMFVSLLGYKHNFGIYKTCKIAFLETVVLVYYVVYDNEMKEQRRFVEIEANEEHTWASEQEAWDEVVKYEKLMESIGVSSRGRLKKSLFEMFRKEYRDNPNPSSN
jgi:adenylate cyclase class IV